MTRSQTLSFFLHCTTQTSDNAYLKEAVFSHLTSRDPQEFWTSGQWMTERGGGSDVGESTLVVEVMDSF